MSEGGYTWEAKSEGVWYFDDKEVPLETGPAIWTWQNKELKPIEPHKYSRKYRRELAKAWRRAQIYPKVSWWQKLIDRIF